MGGAAARGGAAAFPFASGAAPLSSSAMSRARARWRASGRAHRAWRCASRRSGALHVCTCMRAWVGSSVNFCRLSPCNVCERVCALWCVHAAARVHMRYRMMRRRRGNFCGAASARASPTRSCTRACTHGASLLLAFARAPSLTLTHARLACYVLYVSRAAPSSARIPQRRPPPPPPPRRSCAPSAAMAPPQCKRLPSRILRTSRRRS
jgi:hypothetical protein